jgi:hypothetical protein
MVDGGQIKEPESAHGESENRFTKRRGRRYSNLVNGSILPEKKRMNAIFL